MTQAKISSLEKDPDEELSVPCNLALLHHCVMFKVFLSSFLRTRGKAIAVTLEGLPCAEVA